MTAAPVGFSERGLDAALGVRHGSGNPDGPTGNTADVEELHWDCEVRPLRPVDLRVIGAHFSLRVLELSARGKRAIEAASHPDVVAALVSALTNLRQLRSLTLNSIYIDAPVVAAISSLRELEVLQLAGKMLVTRVANVSLNGQSVDLAPLASLSRLRALSLCPADYQPRVDVSTFLPRLSLLTHLEITHCVWGTESLEQRRSNSDEMVLLQVLQRLQEAASSEPAAVPQLQELYLQQESRGVDKLLLQLLSIPSLRSFYVYPGSLPGNLGDKFQELGLHCEVPLNAPWFKLVYVLPDPMRSKLRQLVEQYVAAPEGAANL
jgi:hypothetical protein